MRALYVISLGEAAGKSTLCAGIGRHLLTRGHKIGYLRPVAAAAGKDNALADAAFFIKVFKLAEPAEALCPLIMQPAELATALADPKSQASQKLAASYAQAAGGKDAMLLEGPDGLLGGGELARAAAQAARLLKASVIAIHRYRDDLEKSCQLLTSTFGDALLGVVMNMVPAARLEAVRRSEAVHLANRGIKVLGVLPQERGLATISCAELASSLEAEILNPADSLGGLVENVMLGASMVDHGYLYYQQRSNKAVIARADRADMQLAALRTPTRCLVLSGEGKPHPGTLHESKENGVSLIQTKQDIPAILSHIEASLSRARFRQESKLAYIEKLLQDNFDFASLVVN